MGINYGTDKVRFPAPLPVGSSVRAGAELVSVRETAQGVQAVVKMTIEAADMLYGVSMDDAGVSKVISLRLADLDAERAG